MSQHWRSPESDNEEDDENDMHLTGRDAILFLVDCSKSMFQSINPEKEPRSKFRITIECIEAVMRNRIIMSDTDLIGVVFYNTEHSPDSGLPSDMNMVLPKQTAVFIPIDTQRVENIEKVMEFQETNHFDDFSNKFGHSKDCNLSDVFWFCSKLFTRCGYHTRATSIVLFTDNPLPHPKGSAESRTLLLKANDLQQSEILVSLMPMQPDFDCDLFYKQFLCVVLDEDVDNFQPPTYEDQIPKLTKRIYRRDCRKKANSKVEFLIGGLKLGVALYSMSRKMYKPTKLTMDRDTNDVILKKRVYQQMDSDGAKSVMGPGDQRKSIEFGNEKMFFTTEEHSRVHSLIPRGLRLLGFKPMSAIEKVNFVNPCLFLFPNDERFEGSTNFIAALWARCLARQSAMIAMMVQRYKATPTYVALVPQESDDLRSNGFRVIYLPYKDDQRALDVFTKEAPSVSDEDKEVMNRLLKRIKFRFHPSFFENPELKHYYNNIESIVYKTEEVPWTDTTIPELDERANEACRNVIEHFGEISLDDVRLQKRPATTQGNGQAKIPKLESNVNALDLEVDILAAVKAGKDTQLKVTELREYLKAKGVTGISSAKKSDLIDKVKALHGI